ncbi:hypothetical protein V8B55DRAFT_1536368 [Mucor lusitanicus]
MKYAIVSTVIRQVSPYCFHAFILVTVVVANAYDDLPGYQGKMSKQYTAIELNGRYCYSKPTCIASITHSAIKCN